MYLLQMNFLKTTLHVFVCDSENYMKNDLNFIFLANLLAVTQKIDFGTNIAICSVWSVDSPPELRSEKRLIRLTF